MVMGSIKDQLDKGKHGKKKPNLKRDIIFYPFKVMSHALYGRKACDEMEQAANSHKRFGQTNFSKFLCFDLIFENHVEDIRSLQFYVVENVKVVMSLIHTDS